ncbi:hypothetical protein CHUAL_012425 [Chamberlinius hualienensis]
MISKNILAVTLPAIIAYCIYTRSTFDPNTIRGKIVLVTGASSGIGEQVAYAYAKLGAKVIITARRVELLDGVEKKCKALGAEFVHSVPADMTTPKDRLKLVAAIEQLGGLDILIVNHAKLDCSWWMGTPENFTNLKNIMDINFFSYVNITSILMASLIKSKGYIGVVSSITGKLGHVCLTSYGASKHALQGFFSSLRQELRLTGVGVSVTLIVYGRIASDNALEVAKNFDSSDHVKCRSDFASNAASTEYAADVLVKGVAERAYEVYFPLHSVFLKYLNRLCPQLTENLLADQLLE